MTVDDTDRDRGRERDQAEERDRAFDRLLREKSQAGAASAGQLGEVSTLGTSCLDADMLAAWVDDALDTRERRAAEAHAANCPRCQATLAAMVRTSPAASLPSSDGATTPERAWWRLPALRWLIPIATAAAALVVWMLLAARGSLRGGDGRPTPVTTVARATDETLGPAHPPPEPVSPPAAEGASRAAGSPVDQSFRQAAPTLEAGQDSAREPLAAARVAGRSEEKSASQAATASSVAQPAAAPSAPVASAPGGVVGGVAAPPAPSATAPAAPTSPTAPAGRAAPTAKATETPGAGKAPTAGAAAAPPASSAQATDLSAGSVAPVARPRAQAPRRDLEADALDANASARLAITSANPTSRWRIVPGRSGAPDVVQHSTDGGATWETQPTGLAGPIAAGMSPSAPVCWLVGGGGTVLLSTDGRSWQRLEFPEAVDLVSVRATDGKTATVVTADGRSLVTVDGGATWRLAGR